jgi:hypothetical protein
MNKSKKMYEWQKNKIDEDQRVKTAQKKLKMDERANRYHVLLGEEVVLDTPRLTEAVNLAKEINGKVMWVLDGHAIQYVF